MLYTTFIYRGFKALVDSWSVRNYHFSYKAACCGIKKTTIPKPWSASKLYQTLNHFIVINDSLCPQGVFTPYRKDSNIVSEYSTRTEIVFL